jgi:hypothetical protein
MGWERPILTDSGGYQVMSLAELSKLTEEGVTFKSHLDGTRHTLSPERSIEIQRLLGSDIVMAFDELVPTTSTKEVQAAAMARSMRWAQRSRDAFDGGGAHAEGAAIFGIQQGAHRRDCDAPRHDPHASLHAGRHRRHRQGNEAGRCPRGRCRHHPRQHLSPDAPSRRGEGGQARRVAQVHELAAPDPHR